MSKRFLTILTTLTVLVVLAAAVAIATSRQAEYVPVDVSGVRLVNFSESDEARVAKVLITSDEGHVELARDGAGVWRCESVNGYPAKPDMVAELFDGFRKIRLVAQKTDIADWFGALGVGDAGATQGGSGTMVTFLDSAGKEVAGLQFGVANRYEGGREGGYYVRAKGGKVAYQALGKVPRTIKPLEWIERRLFDFEPGDVEQVRISTDKGDDEAILVPNADAPQGWALANMPENSSLKREEQPASTVTAIAGTRFAGVIRRENMPETREGIHTVIRLRDGITVDIETVRSADAAFYATISAYVDELTAGALGEGAAAVRARAEALTTAYAPWAYELEFGGYTAIRRTLPEFVEDGEAISVSHILVSYHGAVAAGPIERTKEEALARAQEALAKVRKSPEIWGKLTAEYSDDPTGKVGGIIGVIKRGDFIAEFEDAAFALQPGQFSDIVETPLGYHIIKRNK